MKSKQPVFGPLLACADTGLLTEGTKNDKVSQLKLVKVHHPSTPP
ncbi:hypothetical protein [Aetokthonos hydrillicola]|jgi:hypothetical protein|nr:hypothetical protein [Aetokthonos hydrillicola]